ncbi:MAG: crotonase/enoyl-CoA hydratase family protein, partial [Comamonadaceae bacterium]
MTELVTVEVKDGVQIITINRPQARNAMNLEAAQGVAAALDQLNEDPSIVVAVLTGAGGTFCSGMDLKAFAATGQRPYVGDRGFAGLCEKPPTKPLIAAVEGYAVAGGCELALACDLIVAANNSQFGLPEVRRGLVPGSGGMLRLPRHIPYHIAMELALTGESISAERAYQVGLVNRLSEPGQALHHALDMAHRIAGNGPLAVKTIKGVIAESGDWPVGEMFDRQRPLQSIADGIQFISYYHPVDYIRHLARAYEREQSPAARDAMAQILTNSRMCAEGKRPLCQDTGIVNVFLKVGMNVRFDTCMSLQELCDEGVRRGYLNSDNPLRASVLDDPLFTRRNTRDNTPCIVNVELVPGDTVDVQVAAKGGGSENKSKFVMLNPSDSIVDWVLKTVPTMGAGWCPPGM